MNIYSMEETGMTTELNENKLPARLLSIGEVAHFLGVHTSTIRRWGKQGLLKSYAIGLRHNLRYKQEDVLNFLDKCQDQDTHGISLSSSLDKERHEIKVGRR